MKTATQVRRHPPTMARSHLLVALGAALFAALLIAQLIIDFGFPQVDFWHWRLDQDAYHAIPQSRFFGGKQAAELVDDASSSYLIGVGKADITGYAGQQLDNTHSMLTTTPVPWLSST
jgi:hypothetical protein